jgi:hypothetical protein
MSKAKGKQPKQKKGAEEEADPNKFNIYREIRFNTKFNEYPIK